MERRLDGWLRSQEDRNYLANIQKPLGERLREMRIARRMRAPASVDPRPWMQVENQGNMGSCQGHALTSCVELAYHFESGKIIQLSRMFAYVMSQRKDGIRGDSGSTISGGAKCATQDGICLETTYPYPGRYTTNIPQAAIDEAKEYKIRSVSRVKTYDDVFEFLASGAGGINIGIMWTVGDVHVVETYRPGRTGGHALCLGGYTERKDSQGRNYIIMFNSWGRGWGNNGSCEVSPNAIQQMLSAQWTDAVALSDMESVEPREINYRFLD